MGYDNPAGIGCVLGVAARVREAHREYATNGAGF